VGGTGRGAARTWTRWTSRSIARSRD